MKTSIKTFACSVAISIVLLACGDTNGERPISPSSNEEMPIMDSRVKLYNRFGFWSLGDDWGHSLGYFDGIGIDIITNKNMLMSAFPHIVDGEQAECNYFAIQFSYPASYRDYWILSQDMVLHYITPGHSGCAVTTIPDKTTMLVCDDTEEWNLKDKIDIDAVNVYVDPNWDCRYDRVVFFLVQ